MVRYDWLMEQHISEMKVMAGLKFVWTISGEQYVMMSGHQMMQKLSADSLAFLQDVC